MRNFDYRKYGFNQCFFADNDEVASNLGGYMHSEALIARRSPTCAVQGISRAIVI